MSEFKQRSTGEVAAPGMFPDDSYMSNPRNVRKHAEAEQERDGRAVERAAVVKAIDEMLNARDTVHCNPLVALRELRGRITSGGHVK